MVNGWERLLSALSLLFISSWIKLTGKIRYIVCQKVPVESWGLNSAAHMYSDVLSYKPLFAWNLFLETVLWRHGQWTICGYYFIMSSLHFFLLPLICKIWMIASCLFKRTYQVVCSSLASGHLETITYLWSKFSLVNTIFYHRSVLSRRMYFSPYKFEHFIRSSEIMSRGIFWRDHVCAVN